MKKYIYDESNGLWYELFTKAVDFYIVLRYTNYIEVQCIALKLTGGV